MNTQTKLISAAERLFDQNGFNATGMDQLTRAAGMSSRTLYKHAGSKTALITAVLQERDRRFLQQMEVDSVDMLFKALEGWVRGEGCRGCLFLRAHGETGGRLPEVEEVVMAHKAKLYEKIREITLLETRGEEDRELINHILILFEGATAAAIYQGAGAVETARAAALALISRIRS